MNNKIINFIKTLVSIILLFAIMFGVFVCVLYIHEHDCIEAQTYSENHECVEFMSYLEVDEFGDSYITEIYTYSDGHVVENHEYLRVGL